MAAPTIATLPIELVANILELTEDFNTIFSAILACKRFHQAWQSHRHSIEDAVLSASILALPEAKALAAAQLRFHQQSPTTHRAKRMLENQRMANRMSEIYKEGIIRYGFWLRWDEPYLTMTEQARLHGNFYKFWVFNLQQTSPTSANTLYFHRSSYILEQPIFIQHVTNT